MPYRFRVSPRRTTKAVTTGWFSSSDPCTAYSPDASRSTSGPPLSDSAGVASVVGMLESMVQEGRLRLWDHDSRGGLSIREYYGRHRM
jgi:hypothetical protein